MKNLSIAIGFVLSLSTMAFFAHRNQQQLQKNELELKQIQIITRNDINIINADTLRYSSRDSLTRARIKEDSLSKKNSVVRVNL